MAKSETFEDAVDMPEFTQEQIDYIYTHIIRMHTQRKEALTKSEYNQSHKVALAAGVGFMFDALGLWPKFKPSITINAMRGNDPFDMEIK